MTCTAGELYILAVYAYLLRKVKRSFIFLSEIKSELEDMTPRTDIFKTIEKETGLIQLQRIGKNVAIVWHGLGKPEDLAIQQLEAIKAEPEFRFITLWTHKHLRLASSILKGLKDNNVQRDTEKDDLSSTGEVESSEGTSGQHNVAADSGGSEV